jgi:hypothetical protein
MSFGLQGVNESYPAATSGLGVAEYVVLGGTGVTNTNQSGSDVTQATMKLSGGASVTLQLTATIYDSGGNVVTGPTVNWLSYGASPSSFASADPAGTEESYPSPQTFAGGLTVNSTGLVTATVKGQYIVEARVLDGASTGSIDTASQNTKSSVAYGQVVITVLP